MNRTRIATREREEEEEGETLRDVEQKAWKFGVGETNR